MNALRMSGYLANNGHSNLIMTAGGGAFGHVDGGAVFKAGSVKTSEVYGRNIAALCWAAEATRRKFVA